MHPTADYRIDQGTSPPISSTMYTPVPSPMNPMAPPQSTELPWHGAHQGLHQGPQYNQGPYQGSLQGPQQQHYQTPQVYEKRNAYHMQMSQSHWQMHMYHQQQSGSQMIGMTGAPNAPVGIPHPQMHQNPQAMLQNPDNERWLYQGSQIPHGVNTGTLCIPTAGIQNLQGFPQHFETGRMHQSAGINPQRVAQHPPTVQWGHSEVQNFSRLMRDSKTGYPTGIPLPRCLQPRPPKCFTPYQVARLKSRFTKNNEINRYERDEMSEEIGLTSMQIKSWFENRRATVRTEEKRKKQLEELEEKKKDLENIQQELKMPEEEKTEQMEVLELEKKEQTKETMDKEKSYYKL